LTKNLEETGNAELNTPERAAMKLSTLLKWLFTLAICTAVCVVLSPLAQKAPVAARREPLSSDNININTATVDQLESLPHIGTKTAQAIIAYRTHHGPFKKEEDLTKVPGIGEKTFEDLKKHIIL
jgi:competence ComEA-like helix-hairpin-helix protein